MVVYIFCSLLVLIAFISLSKNTVGDNKDKKLDVLSSVLLLISSVIFYYMV